MISKHQLHIDKQIDEIEKKREIGIIKYGEDSQFMKDYWDAYKYSCTVKNKQKIKTMIIELNKVFDKWNIGNRNKKLKRILSRF